MSLKTLFVKVTLMGRNVCMCTAKPDKMAYLALACLYFMFDTDASKLVRKVSDPLKIIWGHKKDLHGTVRPRNPNLNGFFTLQTPCSTLR